MANYTNIAYDCGQGNGKMVGPDGWAMLESYAARKNKETIMGGIDGLKSQRARMTIKLPNGRAFYVGRNAHAAGEPVEALDYDRYNGVPEQRALFYGLLTEYMRKHETTLDRIRLTIGVPLQVLAGERSNTNVQTITDWLEGEHHWEADNKPYQITVTEALVKSQATGALYNYMYDENGHIIRERKSTLVAPKKGGGYQFVPIGILSFGFLTMEAMAVQYQKDESGQLELVKQDRFTASKPVGIHRLLEIARPSHSYTLAELDQQFRDGTLETHDAMQIYRRDVSNALIEAWGRRGWKRFGAIILVGGGSLELGEWLLKRFDGKAFLPSASSETKHMYLDQRGNDMTPILSIALGLYRQAIR